MRQLTLTIIEQPETKQYIDRALEHAFRAQFPHLGPDAVRDFQRAFWSEFHHNSGRRVHLPSHFTHGEE